MPRFIGTLQPRSGPQVTLVLEHGGSDGKPKRATRWFIGIVTTASAPLELFPGLPERHIGRKLLPEGVGNIDAACEPDSALPLTIVDKPC